MYGQVIVFEKFLPLFKKTIKVDPSNSFPLPFFSLLLIDSVLSLPPFFLCFFQTQPVGVGGIAGGDKYVVSGIFFKVRNLINNTKHEKRDVFWNGDFRFFCFHFVDHFSLFFHFEMKNKQQFAKDVKLGERWLYGGDVKSDQNSAKAAGHELVNPMKKRKRRRGPKSPFFFFSFCF